MNSRSVNHFRNWNKCSQYFSLVLFLFLFVICFSSCSQEGEEREPEGPGVDDITVELPEPIIEGLTDEGKVFRFKLTQLSVVKKKVFRINDSIVFTSLEERIKQNKALKEVQLKIKANCVLNSGDVIIKNFTRPLSSSIPIIELMTSEILFADVRGITSCGFFFKAEHKSGSAHHFEIPHLPILDFHKERFIKMLHLLGEGEPASQYLTMNNKEDYLIDTGVEKPIDHLKLVCSGFTLNLPIRSQQFVPFSVLPFYEQEEHIEKQQRFNIERGYRPLCRLFGYVNNVLVAASYFFSLVF